MSQSLAAVEGPAAAVTPSRIAFLDIARVVATLTMLMGHTIDALLGPAYRSTPAFAVWTFFRALTPSTFLFVSGFVLGIVTLRELPVVGLTAASTKRLRRFAFYLALGYVLHLPADTLRQIVTLPADRWRLFFAVDVLQCVAVTLAILQLLVLVGRTRVRTGWLAATLAAVVGLATPWVWTTTAPLALPMWLRGYLSPAAGALFPLFPWLGLPAAGLAFAMWYAGIPVAHAGRRALATFAPVGAACLAAAGLMRWFLWEPVGSTEVGPSRPSQFLLQIGIVCVLLTALAWLVGGSRRRSPLLERFGQESLTVYVVHVCIVYGSPWSHGLRRLLGIDLAPPAVGAVVLTLWSAMLLLAVVWSRCKQQFPHQAREVRLATFGTLAALLIF